ncbi:SGNH/GDSL hydrolase family protein [Rhodoplanes roseus]|uniref:SGNH/GDSL hydrolase family protein n=1 Tax=Rhodoplanes roseus TaxID=29409 RepID=UPI001AEC9092|nr:hypothetical protein [Rhodoplanes roseus]
MHVILLGDSVFDNGSYVPHGGDVITAVREALPDGARATLLARDGATIADLPRQLDRVPADASHLVISIGGNDSLREAGVLDQPARSTTGALTKARRRA